MGFTPHEVVEFAKTKGHKPGIVLTLTDTQLLHADSDKHKRDGIELTIEEYKSCQGYWQNAMKFIGYGK